MQLDSVLLKFHTLHHFWFLLCKLLKDGGVLAPELSENTLGASRVPKFSSQGGFLKQPAFDFLPVDIDKHVTNVELKAKENFSCLLSEMAWSVFCRCLVKGKEFIDYNLCQVFCFVFPIGKINSARFFPLVIVYSLGCFFYVEWCGKE